MKREEQDKRWAELSDDGKQARIKAYNELLEMNSNSDLWTYNFALHDLEELYGKHNLLPAPTYEEVARELFKKGSYQFTDYGEESDTTFNKTANELYFLNFTSPKQAEKLVAIHKLLNVAKFLNKNEDGSDWVPDWKNDDECKWSFCITYNDILKHCQTTNINSSFVYFRAEELLDKAVQILGEDVVRTALTTIY